MIYLALLPNWASLVVQMVKNLPAMQATQVQSLGGEDPLEKACISKEWEMYHNLVFGGFNLSLNAK